MSVREFTLPDLGEGLEDGEIVEWLVDVGDDIALNQTVAQIESAKAIVELPSPFEGSVVGRFGDVGDTVKVGALLVQIAVEDGAASTPAAPEDAPDEVGHTDPDDVPRPLVGYGSEARPAPRAILSTAGSTSAQRDQVRATPVVRTLARQQGIDLTTLHGTGPHGRIRRADLEGAAQSTPVVRYEDSERTPASGATGVGFRGRYPGEVIPVHGIRRRIAEKMEAAHTGIPDAGCSRDTDFTELFATARALTADAAEQGFSVKVSAFVLMSRALITTLRRFPTLNAVYDGGVGEIRLLEDINLGIAVDTDAGLLVPNLKQAHLLSTLALAERIAELVERSRQGRAAPAEMTGGTVTINNFGFFGNDDGSPIINAPESAIFGIGAIRPRPWVVDGGLAVRRVGRVTLSFDHRVCDGGEAGRAITYFSELCESPSRLLLHG